MPVVLTSLGDRVMNFIPGTMGTYGLGYGALQFCRSHVLPHDEFAADEASNRTAFNPVDKTTSSGKSRITASNLTDRKSSTGGT